MLFVLTTVVAGGCSSFDAPTANVAGVSVVDMTGEAMTLSFDLVLTNPNDEPLELYDLHYTLAVDGSKVYTGRRSAQATLAARSSRTVKVPAVARFDKSPAIAQAAFEFELDGRLGYLTPDRISRVLRDLHVRRPNVRFGADGQVDPPDAQ